MIVYQVLCTVPHEIEREWKAWMLDEHIRDAMNTECFEKYTLNVVVNPEQENTTLYVLQYHALTMEDYQHYRSEFAPVLQLAYKAKFGDSIPVERMVLEQLNG